MTWEVNGIAGGNASVGTISTTGVYTPPPTVTSTTQVEIDAMLNSDQTVVGKTNLSVTAPTKSGGGGGGLDPLTLLAQAVALGGALMARGRRWRSGAAL